MTKILITAVLSMAIAVVAYLLIRRNLARIAKMEEMSREEERLFIDKRINILLSELKDNPASLFPIEDTWVINELVKRAPNKEIVYFNIDKVIFKMVLWKACTEEDYAWSNHVKVYQMDDNEETHLYTTDLFESREINTERLSKGAVGKISRGIFLILCGEKEELDIDPGYNPFKNELSDVS